MLWRRWCFLGANELRQLALIEMVVGVMVLVGGIELVWVHRGNDS